MLPTVDEEGVDANRAARKPPCVRKVGPSDYPTIRPVQQSSGGKASKRPPNIPLTKPLESSVAQLSDALAGDAEHGADLFEGVLAAPFQAEVEAQYFCVAWREGGERLLDLVGEEAVHRLLLGVGHLVGDEPLDERAVAFRVHGRVEAHVARVEGGERLHHVHRESGEHAQLLRARLTIELLPENLTRLDDAGEIG